MIVKKYIANVYSAIEFDGCNVKRMVAKVLFYIISKDNMKNNKTRYSVYLKNSKSCLVTRCIFDKWKLSQQFFIDV